MIAPRARMLKLMAYADGELSGGELAEVERWIAEDAEAARFVDQMAGLGDVVVEGHAASAGAKAARGFDIADAVMAKVAEAPKKAEVVSLAAARAGRRTRVVAMVGAALALAASVLFMARTKEEEAPLARGPAPVVQPAPATSSGPGAGVEVETAGHSVSVFYLPSEQTLTTSVVVWVDESGEKK